MTGSTWRVLHQACDSWTKADEAWQNGDKRSREKKKDNYHHGLLPDKTHKHATGDNRREKRKEIVA